MLIRNILKRFNRQQFTQVRFVGKHDDPSYTQLFPKIPEEKLPEIDPDDYVPEDKYKFRRPKEGIPSDWISFMTQPIDLRPQTIKRWFYRKTFENTVRRQSNVRERRILYGIELGAAVFMLELNGSIRFKNHALWTKMSEENKKKSVLPTMPLRGTIVEEIDASDTTLLYEGIDNIAGLRGLKTLVLSNCPFIDDWCLDKISGKMRHTLTSLKISNCPRITERGLAVLPRLKHLESLSLNNLPGVNHPALVSILLEEAMPKCRIEGVDYMNDEIFDEEKSLPESERKEFKKFQVQSDGSEKNEIKNL